MKYCLYLFMSISLFSSSLVEQDSKSSNATNQTANASQVPLENNKQTLKGTLENGMTYYIHKNSYPKNGASVRLVVKAGSLDESESERGLAHFLEHMVFRGTKKYKDLEIKHYIESMGGKFGHNLNAFTSCETTEYHFTLAKTNLGDLSKGLDILNEMMFEAKFDKELLDKERGVVINEKLMYEQYLKSHYKQLMNMGFESMANRLPIGTDEVIHSATPEKLRSFYQRQYTPDKMSIIITGDAEPDQVLKRVQTIFTKKMTSNKSLRRADKIVQEKEPRAIVIKEEKLGKNFIMFQSVKPLTKSSNFTSAKIRESLIKEFSLKFLQKHMDEKAKATGLYWLSMANASNWNEYFSAKTFGFGFIQGSELVGCKQFIEDMQSVLSQKIDKDSLLAFKNVKIGSLQKEIDNSHLFQNSSYINLFRDDFLMYSGYPSFIDYNTALIAQAYKVTSNDIYEYCLKLKKEFLCANIITVLTTQDLNFEKQDLLDVVKQARSFKPKMQEEVKTQKDLNIELKAPKEDCIKWTQTESASIEGKLKNGMSVIVHPNHEKKNEAHFMLLANGGSNLIDAKDLPSVQLCASVASDSGLANLDGFALANYLEKHEVALNQVCSGCCCPMKLPMFQLGVNSRIIKGTCKTDSLDESFKVLNAMFTAKRFSREVFDQAHKKAIQIEKSVAQNADVKFFKWIHFTLFKGMPLFKDYMAQEASFESAKNIIDQVFVNPSDFCLIVSGDVALDNVEAKILKYLSPLDNKSKSVTCKYPCHVDVQEKEYTRYADDITVPIGVLSASLEQKEYTYERAMCMNLLQNVMQERLFSGLRLDKGESYTSMCGFSSPTGQLQSQFFEIFFLANKGKVPALFEKVAVILDELYEKGVSQKELSLAKVKLLTQKELSEQDPTRFVDFHSKRITCGFSQKNLLDYKRVIQENCDLDKIHALLMEIKAAPKAKFSRVQKQ